MRTHRVYVFRGHKGIWQLDGAFHHHFYGLDGKFLVQDCPERDMIESMKNPVGRIKIDCRVLIDERINNLTTKGGKLNE